MRRYLSPFDLRDTLTVALIPCPGEKLRKAVRAAFRPKCVAVLLDPAINSRGTILRNVHDMFLIAAAKCHSSCRRLDFPTPKVSLTFHPKLLT